MKNAECVLFDLDGVLVDACEWHYESLNKALNEILGITISRKDHTEKYNGLPTKLKLNLLQIPEQYHKDIWIKKQEYTLETIKTNIQIDDKKLELLKFLKSKNIKIGCVTNSIKETAYEMLKASHLFEFFDIIITNEDVKKNKPNPECYNLAIDALQISPEKCICVEDSPNGIKAAHASKSRYVWEVQQYKEVTLENFLEFIK